VLLAKTINTGIFKLILYVSICYSYEANVLNMRAHSNYMQASIFNI